MEDDLASHSKEIQIKVHQQAVTPQGDKVEKATTNATNLKEELTFNEGLLKSYKEQYSAIQAKIKAGGVLSSNERQFVSIYDEIRGKVDQLSDSYKNAAINAELL